MAMVQKTNSAMYQAPTGRHLCRWGRLRTDRASRCASPAVRWVFEESEHDLRQ